MRSARVLVCVTFLFRRDRLRELSQVLREFAEYQVAQLDVVIETNVAAGPDYELLLRVARDFLAPTQVTLSIYSALENLRILPWCHHMTLRHRFLSADSAYTHFVLVEDDLRFSFANFSYFVANREKLRAFGLVPSFLRVEYNATAAAFFCADAQWSADIAERPKVAVDGTTFVEPLFPYIGMYVLDRALAAEYAHSPSFDFEASKQVCDWQIMERATLGVCYVNPPAGFASRYVIPIETTLRPKPICWVHHLTDRYTIQGDAPLGHIPVTRCFVRADAAPFQPRKFENSRRSGHRVREAVRDAIYGGDPWTDYVPAGRGDRQPEGFGDNDILVSLLDGVPGKLAVDVGVWKGRSAIALATRMRDEGMDGCVVAVDTFLGSAEHWTAVPLPFRLRQGRPDLYETFLDNVLSSGCAEYIVPLPQTATTAARLLAGAGLSAGLVHVDMGPSYHDALISAVAFWPIVEAGGVLVGGGYATPDTDVGRAAAAFAGLVGEPIVVQGDKWIVRRPGP